MKKIALILLFASVAAFPFSACKPMMPTEPFHMEVVRCDAETIRAAIIAGCAARSWSPSDLRPGVIRARLLRRSHDLTVDIHYTDHSYTIEYVGSHNLDYNPRTGEIDRRYVKWVLNLDKRIRYELSVLRKEAASAADYSEVHIRYEADAVRAETQQRPRSR